MSPAPSSTQKPISHYFATRDELLAFACELVIDRATARISGLRPVGDVREQVAALLRETLPPPNSTPTSPNSPAAEPIPSAAEPIPGFAAGDSPEQADLVGRAYVRNDLIGITVPTLAISTTG